MGDTIRVLLPFGHGLGLAALLVVLHSELMRAWPGRSRLFRDLTSGLVFALSAILSMLDPAMLASGIVIDARNVIVGLAGIVAGPVGAIASGGAAAAYRLWIGGVGAPAGVLGVAIAAGAGLAVAALIRRAPHELGLRHLVLLGFAVNLSLLSVLILPPGARYGFLTTAAPAYFLATSLGVIVFGTMLVRECRRLVLEEQAHHDALRDALTELPNRRAFEETLGRALAGDPARGDVALLLIDLDHFKQVNDRGGHARGDAALCAVAEAMTCVVRREDLAARLGGDEFAIVARGLSRAGAETLAERLRRVIVRLPLDIAGAPISVSIGIAAREGRAIAAAEILAEADGDLYAAKRRRPVALAA